MSSETKWGIGLMLIGAAIGIAGAILEKRLALILSAILFLLGLLVLFIPARHTRQQQIEEMKQKIRDIQNSRRSVSRGGVLDAVLPSADEDPKLFREAMRQIEREDRQK